MRERANLGVERGIGAEGTEKEKGRNENFVFRRFDNSKTTISGTFFFKNGVEVNSGGWFITKFSGEKGKFETGVPIKRSKERREEERKKNLKTRRAINVQTIPDFMSPAPLP